MFSRHHYLTLLGYSSLYLGIELLYSLCMGKKKTYTIKATLWIYPGQNGNWHFLTVGRETSKAITEAWGKAKRGWGSLPVSVRIGKTTWETSIFPDNKSGTYLLPIKAKVRGAEGLFEGDTTSVRISVNL